MSKNRLAWEHPAAFTQSVVDGTKLCGGGVIVELSPWTSVGCRAGPTDGSFQAGTVLPKVDDLKTGCHHHRRQKRAVILHLGSIAIFERKRFMQFLKESFEGFGYAVITIERRQHRLERQQLGVGGLR